MKIKFCGAASGVTGSCHLISTEDRKILLDCGMFQGSKVQEALNYEPFQFDPAEIDFVIISHAHIDHCGRLPLLVKNGFQGQIYCTNATGNLLPIMLTDSGHIQEKEAEWKTRKAERNGRPPVEPLYTIEDAERVIPLLKPILYDQLVNLTDKISIVFNDAGHILGSAITELWIEEDGNVSKLVFTGDLGVPHRPILRDPVKIKKADYIIMETTYGNRLHPENSTGVEALFKVVLETIRRGGSVIIPSFAVGRTQELIFEFARFYDQHEELRNELDDLTVYIDSPMATNVTQVFRENAQVFDEETRRYILEGKNPLDFPNLKFTRSSEESRQLNFDRKPKVIISASGMCEAGRIRHHLKHNLWDPKNSIVFVGYQAEGTLGRHLIEGAEEISLFGEIIKVNAEIHNLEGFSGHADRDGLLDWLMGLQMTPKHIFLVHGEEDSKLDFAKTMKERLGLDAEVILGVSEYDLVKDEITNREQALKDALDDAAVLKMRDKISSIHDALETILYNTQLAMGEDIAPERIVKINNLLLMLEKNTLNLGSMITIHDTDDIQTCT